MPPTHNGDGDGDRVASPDGPDEPQRVAALRGAGVSVDARRLGVVAAVAGLVAVMVVAGILLAAGIKKNAQIDSLRSHGVPVIATVTKCLALVGGTGQSPAGFECTATYDHDGRHYTEGVPGSQNLPVGSTVQGVVGADDPALFSTPPVVAAERTTAAIVVAPALVLVLAGAACVVVVVRHRRRSDGPTERDDRRSEMTEPDGEGRL